MLNHRFVFLAIFGLACAAGCSQKRTEIQYAGMIFRSPHATGKFQNLDVSDPVSYAALKRADLPTLFIRLDGRTVLLLSELTRGEAAEHFEKLQPMAAGANPDSGVFLRKHEGMIVLQLDFEGTDDNERVKLSVGNFTGQSQDPGLEIGSSRDGPFFRFPLSRANIIEMFGPSSEEFTRPYEYHN